MHDYLQKITFPFAQHPAYGQCFCPVVYTNIFLTMKLSLFLPSPARCIPHFSTVAVTEMADSNHFLAHR